MEVAERALGRRRALFDFAGSGVVHVVGGCSALLSVIVVGPRRGRFTSARKPNDLPAQSPVFQVIGGLFYGTVGSDSIAEA